MRNRALLLVAIVSVLVGACDRFPDSDWPELPGTVEVDALRALPRFSATTLDTYPDVSALAEDLDSYGYQVAMMYLEDPSLVYRIGGYGCGDVLAEDTSAESDTAGYSTNVQVEGVDEMDSVKSDGRFVFACYGSEIVCLSAEGEVLDREAVFSDTPIMGLLVAGNRILALGSPTYGDTYLDLSTPMALYDFSDTGSLSLAQSGSHQGECRSARSVGEYVYLSFVRYLDHSLLIDGLAEAVPPETMVDSDARRARGVAGLDTLIPRWRNAVLTDLFASGSDVNAGLVTNTIRMVTLADGEAGDVAGFADLYESFTEIVGLSLASGLDPVSEAGTFSSGTAWSSSLYADGEHIVVANAAYEGAGTEWHQMTFLYLFSSDQGVVSPASSGAVEGHGLGQFSLDIEDGYLRVATCSDAIWSFDEAAEEWAVTQESVSRVTVLSLDGAGMTVAGTVEGLGLGERLYAVRFLGDVGLAVTFEQTDPFYTIDLSDPYHPAVLGELEIPGFSLYLHPMDADHILGVGRDAGGIGSGLQVSVFDISNLAAPALCSRYSVESEGWSEAEWDHHALRYLASSGTLVLPVVSWGTDYEVRFEVLNASPAGDLSLVGTVDFGTISACWSRDAVLPQRSLLLGDVLVTTAGSMIKGHHMVDLTPIWSLEL